MSDRFIAVRCEGVVHVHAIGTVGDYATLCALDGYDDGVEQEIADLPKRPKITCPDCQMLILFARTYTKKDFSKRKATP